MSVKIDENTIEATIAIVLTDIIGSTKFVQRNGVGLLRCVTETGADYVESVAFDSVRGFDIRYTILEGVNYDQ